VVSQYAGLAVGLSLIPLFGLLIAWLAGCLRGRGAERPVSVPET